MGAAAAIGIIDKAKGELTGGLDATTTAQYQKVSDLQNQSIAEQASEDALNRGAQQAGRIRMQGAQLAAQQRVAFANSGIDVNTGTPVDVGASTAALGELDAQTARNNAARDAWGFQVQATRYGQQAQRDEAARQGAILSTVAGSGGQIVSSFDQAGQSGGLTFGGGS